MDLTQLANLGEFIGGVGSAVGAAAVLATLIYLALQVKQNTQAVRASSAQAFTDSMNGVQLLIAGNLEQAHIWRLAMDDPGSMTEDERVAADWICLSAGAAFESALLQGELGSLDRQTYEMICKRIRESFAVDYYRGWWDRRAFSFTERFVRFVENECGVDAANSS